MSNIDFSQVVTAEAREAAAMAEARDAARAQLNAWVEAEATGGLGRPAPLDERLGWGAKEAAARALAAGRADDTQEALIAREAAETGESVSALAEKIIRKADRRSLMIAALTGVRRKAEAAIAAAATPEAVAAAVNAATAKASPGQ